MTISSPASDHTLSSTEHAVLGVLAEGPAHGFAVARELAPGTDLGRILTVRRPLVYRALDRLIEAGFAEAVTIEPGDAGPRRTVLQVTRWGRRRLDGWLAQPVEHVRDIRIDFLLKISLIVRSGGDPGPLTRAQRSTLQATLQALEEPTSGDHVELWRHHNALAATGYLDDLERRFD